MSNIQQISLHSAIAGVEDRIGNLGAISQNDINNPLFRDRFQDRAFFRPRGLHSSMYPIFKDEATQQFYIHPESQDMAVRLPKRAHVNNNSLTNNHNGGFHMRQSHPNDPINPIGSQAVRSVETLGFFDPIIDAGKNLVDDTRAAVGDAARLVGIGGSGSRFSQGGRFAEGGKFAEGEAAEGEAIGEGEAGLIEIGGGLLLIDIAQRQYDRYGPRVSDGVADFFRKDASRRVATDPLLGMYRDNQRGNGTKNNTRGRNFGFDDPITETQQPVTDFGRRGRRGVDQDQPIDSGFDYIPARPPADDTRIRVIDDDDMADQFDFPEQDTQIPTTGEDPTTQPVQPSGPEDPEDPEGPVEPQPPRNRRHRDLPFLPVPIFNRGGKRRRRQSLLPVQSGQDPLQPPIKPLPPSDQPPQVPQEPQQPPQVPEVPEVPEDNTTPIKREEQITNAPNPFNRFGHVAYFQYPNLRSRRYQNHFINSIGDMNHQLNTI